MKISKIVLLVFLCISFNALSCDHKYWNDTISLSRNDFLIQDCGEVARIRCAVSIKSEYTKESLVFHVRCYMIPCESYYCTEEDSLLSVHETTHFRIAEISARSIRKQISQIKPCSAKKMFDKVQIIYTEGMNLLEHKQNQYDEETDHGTILEIQKKYDKQTKYELSKLNDYSDFRVEVKIK